MAKQSVAADRERRKHVKLRIRGDIVITPQKYEGRTFYVVKDPVSLRYYRFKEQEHYLIQMMDGKHTLDEAQKAFEKRFRPDRLTLEDLEQFGQQLLKAGLVQNETPAAGKLLYEQRSKRTRQKMMQNFTNILYVKIPIFDPEKLLTKMLPPLRWIFTTSFLLLSVVFMLSALMLFLTHFEAFRERMPSFQEFFSFKTVVYVWAALGVVKVIHEFGHGLSCKAFGGEVHEMGFLLLCLSPAMYCNVSDSWTLPSKWKRVLISFAGIYVELMIAAAATWIWWYTPSQPFVNYLSLCLMMVCSVSTVIFNGNPLMRFDGYYILADILEIPNLRERANKYLTRLFQEYALGIEQQPEPYMALSRKILFVTYAVVSYLYRWFITFVILYFMATFLKPYKLEVLSQFLALFALGSMFGWPLARMIQNYNKRGRLPDMKMLNVSITVTFFTILILIAFLVPMPVSRIRTTGIVQLNPKALEPIPVRVPGILEDLGPDIREGARVTKGQTIAVFENINLIREYQQAKTTAGIKRNVYKSYNSILNTQGSNIPPEEFPKIQQRQANILAELLKAKVEMESLERLQKRLNLRAPKDGIIIGLPKKEEFGRMWEREKSPPICKIGDPMALEVLLPITPDDYQLLVENLKIAEKAERELAVTIRVHGRGSNTWEGTVNVDELPNAVAKTIPLALSTKGGGPLAVKPTSKENEMIPQVQVYLIPITIKNPDSAIVPGTMAQVKIHCEYRSIAWWAWRTISKTFDLGLM
ncbi:MAG: site-2 protease family protein [Gemmataceae bacterium]